MLARQSPFCFRLLSKHHYFSGHSVCSCAPFSSSPHHFSSTCNQKAKPSSKDGEGDGRKEKEGHTAIHDHLVSIPNYLPKIEWGFAYGSAVFPQPSHSGDMVDFVFVVRDPYHWHKQNMIKNPSHYWWLLRLGGPSFLSFLQRWKTPLFYITDIPLKSSGPIFRSKYGIISENEMEKDLSSWSSLYLSGRLHKPVLFLPSPPSPFPPSLSTNLLSATAASLLQLPTHFSSHDFFEKVAELSYLGDIRVGLAESPDKIQKLVQSGGGGRGRGGEEGGGRVTMLHGMYEPHLKKFSVEERGEEGGRIKFVQRKEREEFERLVGSLPSSVLSQMDCGWKSNTENNEKVKEIALAFYDNHQENKNEMIEKLRTSIGTIVKKSSKDQTSKGIFSASPLSVASYVLRKVRKTYGF